MTVLDGVIDEDRVRVAVNEGVGNLVGESDSEGDRDGDTDVDTDRVAETEGLTELDTDTDRVTDALPGRLFVAVTERPVVTDEVGLTEFEGVKVGVMDTVAAIERLALGTRAQAGNVPFQRPCTVAQKRKVLLPIYPGLQKYSTPYAVPSAPSIARRVPVDAGFGGAGN